MIFCSKKRTVAFRRLFLLAVIMALGMPAAFGAEGDWIYRQDLVFNVKLQERFSLISRSSAFVEKDISNLEAYFTGLNLGYHFLPQWRAEIGYRHVWLDPGGLERAERRSQVALAWSDSYQGWKVGNRSRLEFRDYDWNRKDDIRFRNQTAVVTPSIPFLWKFRPYMEEEFFIGKNSRKFEQNWLTAGLTLPAHDVLSIKAGYRWITVRVSDRWENRNMLVTNLSFKF